MKKLSPTLFTTLVAVALFALNSFASETVFEGFVTKIVDGDTIHFRDSAGITKRDLKIRMVGMDAPEAHFQNANGDIVGQSPWGDRAGQVLERLIPVGTKVTIRSSGLDKYHRVLGKIFYKGKDVNLMMIKLGMAIPYVICEGLSCNEQFFVKENVREYLETCDAAREKEAGIFDPSERLTEMPFEFRMRQAESRPSKFVGDAETRRLVAPSEYKKIDLCRRVFFLKEDDALRVGFRY